MDNLLFLLCASLSAATLALNLNGSLWIDELLTAWVTSGSLSEVISRSLKFQGTTPLYFLLVYGFRNIFGSSEFSLRLLSFISFPISLWLCMLLGRALKDHKTGSIIGLTLLCSTATIFSFGNARPYGLAIMFGLLSSLLFLSWLRAPRILFISCYGFVSIVAVLIHLFFATVILSHAVILLLVERSRKQSVQYLSFLICFLTVFALCLFQLRGLYLMRNDITPYMGVSSRELILRLISPYIIIINLVCLAYYRIKDGDFRSLRSRDSLIGSALLGVPILCLLIGFAFGAITLLPRYFLSVIPGIVFFTGNNLSRVHSRISIPALTLIAIIVWAKNLESGPHSENWRAAVNSAYALHREHPEKAAALFAGLAELHSQKVIESEDYKPYLRSPLAYYQFSAETYLLPYPDRSWFDEVTLDLRSKASSSGLIAIIRNETTKGSTTLNDIISRLRPWSLSNLQSECYGSICVITADGSSKTT